MMDKSTSLVVPGIRYPLPTRTTSLEHRPSFRIYPGSQRQVLLLFLRLLLETSIWAVLAVACGAGFLIASHDAPGVPM